MKKAFSLIELSIVILVIGILVAGVTSSSRLVSRMKLSSAQSITRSSPVTSITGIVAWFESSLESSFEPNIANQDQVGVWNDINPQSSFKYVLTQSNADYRPTFIQSGINGVPSLKFNNSNLQLSNFMLNGNYTYFVVFKRSSDPNNTGMDLLSLSSSDQHGLLFEIQPTSGAWLGLNRRLRALHRYPFGTSTENDNYTSASYLIQEDTSYIATFVRNTSASSSSTNVQGVSVGEGGTLSISAPSGSTITAIPFASYGTPNTSNWTIGWCHASNSQSIVQSYCVGRQSCNVPADNGTYGDPCFGTYKALAVRYEYSSVASAAPASGGGVSTNIYINGNIASDPAYNATTIGAFVGPTNFVVGNLLPSNFSRPFLGMIGEIIIYDRALKADELLDIHKYLAKKYGIKITQ